MLACLVIAYMQLISHINPFHEAPTALFFMLFTVALKLFGQNYKCYNFLPLFVDLHTHFAYIYICTYIFL